MKLYVEISWDFSLMQQMTESIDALINISMIKSSNEHSYAEIMNVCMYKWVITKAWVASKYVVVQIKKSGTQNNFYHQSNSGYANQVSIMIHQH